MQWQATDYYMREYLQNIYPTKDFNHIYIFVKPLKFIKKQTTKRAKIF